MYNLCQERKYGRPVKPDELFIVTHTNKKGVRVYTCACETYANYLLIFSLIYLYFPSNFLSFSSSNDCVGKLP